MTTSRKWPFKLTTVDNPYSPFDDWDRWYSYDLYLGHGTCNLLSRMTSAVEGFYDEAEIMAMRDIVESNFSGKHVMVVPSDYNPFLSSDITV